MEDVPPPKFDEMVTVMKYMYESCRKKHIPVGVAPNIEVSLIVQPDDGRYLVPRNSKFYWNEFSLKLKRLLAFHFIFKNELKPHQILTDEADNEIYKKGWSDPTKYSPLVVSEPNNDSVHQLMR
jgi:hypothetical protein